MNASQWTVTRLGVLIVVCGFGTTVVPAAPTFSNDIGPILYDNCMTCHRPGQSAPFSLITYQDARKHGRQIVDVISSRFMPPWLPEPGFTEFIGQRSLSEEQIKLIRDWVDGDFLPGDPAELRAPPIFSDGWQLGEPDMVVQLPEPYELQADGRDIFRNFVVPMPVTEDHYVRAVEFRPGNALVVHHSIMRVDRTDSSRIRDALDDEMGYDGMDMGDAELPDGHFLAWTPGWVMSEGTDGLSWRLSKDTDLIIQLHLHPSGKPELVQPSVGLYFADKPPTRDAWSIVLQSSDLDIPPGVTDFLAEDTFVLPSDVEVFSVYPHAHYLGKDMKAFATLPDGSVRWLVRIEDWDFNWQDEYRLVEPMPLPAGTTITMKYLFDNSSENVRNPNYPPKLVVGGNQSTDEMAKLLLGVTLADEKGLDQLQVALARERVDQDFNDPVAQFNLGLALGKLGQTEDAIPHLRRAIDLAPSDPRGHASLGDMLQLQGKAAEAIPFYTEALRLDPGYAEAHYNLGNAYMTLGHTNAAVVHFREALRLNPEDAQAQNNLANILSEMGELEEAIDLYNRALRLSPNSDEIRHNLKLARQILNERDQASALVQESLSLMRVAEKHFAAGEIEAAVAAGEKALELARTAQVDEVSVPISERVAIYKQFRKP